MRRGFPLISTLFFLGLAAAPPVGAIPIPLINNGGFETGDFTGWTVTNQADGAGTFIVTGASTTPSGFGTAGPAGGSSYAVSDFGPGAHALSQAFTVPGPALSVILSFNMFVNDWSGVGPIVDPSGLDFAPGGGFPFVPNQHARVDILSAGASAFDTGAGVLQNLFLGVDPSISNPNPYASYVFNITGTVGAGGTFVLRFAEVDNQFFLNLGVDNVSINFAPVPEPGTLLLLGSGVLGLGIRVRRRRRHLESPPKC
jgi:hypothetical protein